MVNAYKLNMEGRKKQEFKAIFSYVMSSRTAWGALDTVRAWSLAFSFPAVLRSEEPLAAGQQDKAIQW